MRYVIMPILVILYLWAWYHIIKDWRNIQLMESDKWKSRFIVIHICIALALFIAGAIYLTIKFW